jgi:hypothetical protein
MLTRRTVCHGHGTPYGISMVFGMTKRKGHFRVLTGALGSLTNVGPVEVDIEMHALHSERPKRKVIPRKPRRRANSVANQTISGLDALEELMELSCETRPKMDERGNQEHNAECFSALPPFCRQREITLHHVSCETRRRAKALTCCSLDISGTQVRGLWRWWTPLQSARFVIGAVTPRC